MNTPLEVSYYSCLSDAWRAAIVAGRPVICAIGPDPALWWVCPSGFSAPLKPERKST